MGTFSVLLTNLSELFRPQLSVIIVAIHRQTGTVPLLSILISLDHASCVSSILLLFFSIQTPSEFSKLLKKGNVSVDQYYFKKKIEQIAVIAPIMPLFLHRYLLVTCFVFKLAEMYLKEDFSNLHRSSETFYTLIPRRFL